MFIIVLVESDRREPRDARSAITSRRFYITDVAFLPLNHAE